MNRSAHSAARPEGVMSRLLRFLPGMFNLNDPRWGRGGDEPPAEQPRPRQEGGEEEQRPRNPGQQRPQGPNQGPPDLDELWRDFNRKLGGLFGGGGQGGGRQGGTPGGFNPSPKSTGIGVGLIGGVAVLVWLGTGFFIVQEGQQAVITQFGKYHSTVGAGFNWRLPYPVQRHETVFVTQLRSVDVGRDTIVPATGIRESSMLTEDENIVDLQLVVQYNIEDVKSFVLNVRNPETSLQHATDSALRHVVGSSLLDEVISTGREQIGVEVMERLQEYLDIYETGIHVVKVNIQDAKPPNEVKAAYDDVIKAREDQERVINEAQSYSNAIIPEARGRAQRIIEEAEGYKARVVAEAEGEAQRFENLLEEYAKAPDVTRQRLYLEAMQNVMTSSTKVMVNTSDGNNIFYLPLDKAVDSSGATPGSQGLSAAQISAIAEAIAKRVNNQTGATEKRGLR